MLDAFRCLLCSKLCWHNRPVPSYVVIYMYILAFVLCQSYIGDKGVLKFILFNHVPINPSTITATAKMPVGKP